MTDKKDLEERVKKLALYLGMESPPREELEDWLDSFAGFEEMQKNGPGPLGYGTG